MTCNFLQRAGNLLRSVQAAVAGSRRSRRVDKVIHVRDTRRAIILGDCFFQYVPCFKPLGRFVEVTSLAAPAATNDEQRSAVATCSRLAQAVDFNVWRMAPHSVCSIPS